MRQELNGDKVWTQRGRFHRLDGPAIEYADGHKQWWIEGILYGHGDAPPTDFELQALIYEGLNEKENKIK